MHHNILLTLLYSLGAENEEAIQKYLYFVSIPDSCEEKTYLHHILPRCLAPDYTSLKDHPWNGVRLVWARHLEAHRLLTLVLPSNQRIKMAYDRMKSGLWRGLTKGYISMHRDGLEKVVLPSEIKSFLDQGWQFGKRKGKKWVFKVKSTDLLVGRGNTHKRPYAAKNSPRGYKWYSDGTDEWLLSPSDSRMPSLTLGRVKSNRGRVWVNDGKSERQVFREDLPHEFKLGRLRIPSTLGRKWMCKGGVNCSVQPEDFEARIAAGYQFGMSKNENRESLKETGLYNNGLIELRIKKTTFNATNYPGFTPGRLDENKLSATRTGHRWATDGVKNIQISSDAPPPEGFVLGKAEHKKRKEYPTGRKWYTNGVIQIQMYTGADIPVGFTLGRLPHRWKNGPPIITEKQRQAVANSNRLRIKQNKPIRSPQIV